MPRRWKDLFFRAIDTGEVESKALSRNSGGMIKRFRGGGLPEVLN